MSLPRPRQVIGFLLLGRPHFLVGGVALFTLGVAMARYYGVAIDTAVWLWGQLAVSSIQLMTHYSNDYFDLAGDRANPAAGRWSGGSRILVDGLVPPRAALVAAIALSTTAIVALAVLWLVHGIPTAAVVGGLLALAVSWSYSAPPFRLHSRGLGEVVAALLVTGTTPAFSFALQAGRVEPGVLLATLPVCAVGFAMLLSVAFPDAAADAAVGKRTLVVRLGNAGAARLYAVVLVAAYATLPLLALRGLPLAVAVLPVAGLPLAVAQSAYVSNTAGRPPPALSAWAFRSVLLLGTTIVAEMAGFLLVSARGALP
ncbi:MAG: prenyltransferase [Anaerolineae bacterium]